MPTTTWAFAVHSILLALLASGCGGGALSAGGAAPSALAAEPLAWGPCVWEQKFLTTIGGGRAKKFQQDFELTCASVAVPLDHDAASDKGGRSAEQLHIALSRTRIKDGGPTRRRPLLVNFGGPGAAGVQNAAALALRAEDELGPHFDVIGFDPRGVGESDPVTCGPDPAREAQQPILDARDTAQLAKLRARLSAVGQDCAAAVGTKLPHFNTYQTAQDLDSVRGALGVDQIDYLGYSYGTFLGATYAHLHPKQVHAMVLDSSVDLRRDPAAIESEMLRSLEATWEAFFDWTKAQPAYADLATSRGFLAQAFLDPDAGQLFSGVRRLLHAQKDWPALAEGLRALMSTGDSSPLRVSDPGLSMANWAVSCNDLPKERRSDDAAVQRLATDWEQQYPMFGRFELGYGNEMALGCTGWTAPAHPVTPDSIDTAGAPAPLVIGGELDPATPLAWAAPFAKAVGGQLLVTAEPGHGHYLRGARHSCVDQAVDAYLVDGKLPADSLRCPA